MDDFFAELEAEANKHIALAQTKAKASKLKAMSNNRARGVTTEMRTKAAEEYKELAAILAAAEWASVSTIALFSEQRCDGCGSVSRIFLQFMELQQLIRQPTTQKWVRVSRPAPAELLPRETVIQPHYTHICSDCCEDHGFSLDHPSTLAPASAPVAPSASYHQEDINAPTS